jgi:hypothetical protein
LLAFFQWADVHAGKKKGDFTKNFLGAKKHYGGFRRPYFFRQSPALDYSNLSGPGSPCQFLFPRPALLEKLMRKKLYQEVP